MSDRRIKHKIILYKPGIFLSVVIYLRIELFIEIALTHFSVGSRQECLDTGSENTIITRTTAQRLGIVPVTYTLSAGVGRVGLRGLQLARIDSLELGSLKLRNVPCLIKNPPLRDIPI
jgi:hypothetical protein